MRVTWGKFARRKTGLPPPRPRAHRVTFCSRTFRIPGPRSGVWTRAKGPCSRPSARSGPVLGASGTLRSGARTFFRPAIPSKRRTNDYGGETIAIIITTILLFYVNSWAFAGCLSCRAHPRRRRRRRRCRCRHGDTRSVGADVTASARAHYNKIIQ